MGGNSLEDKMSPIKRQYAANYRKPPIHIRFKKGQSGNPRGRPAKNLAALLAAALNEKVTVTENGKRRQVTKREAVIAQLVNKSAAAELRATKMLIDMLLEVEKTECRTCFHMSNWQRGPIKVSFIRLTDRRVRC
jgi:hypothetical protein